MALLQYYHFSIEKHGVNEEEIDFVIEKGQNVETISDNLFKADLIDSTLFFETYIWETGNGIKLQAGKYILDKKMSIKEIVDKLISGDVARDEKTIKILEGWTIDDIENYLVENEITKPGEFSGLAKVYIGDWSMSFAKPDILDDAPSRVDLEGYLFPDTYRIFSSATAEDIVEKLLGHMELKLDDELRVEIKKQGRSIHEVLTLASIIEKEVVSEEDMAIVSGLLQKRMEIGMKLEVDSSVNYATGKSDPSASYVDLQIDSPYNTYKYFGLPPGPISNPGFRAIKAAVYPEESPYLFYLNRQDTGETIFSQDYNEHIRNKNKYLK